MLILWGYIIDMVGVLVCLLSRVTFEKDVSKEWGGLKYIGRCNIRNFFILV